MLSSCSHWCCSCSRFSKTFSRSVTESVQLRLISAFFFRILPLSVGSAFSIIWLDMSFSSSSSGRSSYRNKVKRINTHISKRSQSTIYSIFEWCCLIKDGNVNVIFLVGLWRRSLPPIDEFGSFSTLTMSVTKRSFSNCETQCKKSSTTAKIIFILQTPAQCTSCVVTALRHNLFLSRSCKKPTRVIIEIVLEGQENSRIRPEILNY